MFDRSAITFLMMISLLPLSGCAPRFLEKGSLPEPGSHFFSLITDGQRRGFLLHLPPKAGSDRPVPLVVVFHGYAASARSIERVSGMSEKADREGFAVVYPQGTGFIRTVWNAGFCCGDALLRGVDDREFFGDLIAALEGSMKIDPDRVYVAGFSNGGMLAYSLAATMPSVIAAAAVVSGTAGVRLAESRQTFTIPEPAAPVPLVVFHGIKDRHLPYYGGAGLRTSGEFEFFSVAESLAFWVRANGCDAVPARDSRNDGRVLVDTYTCSERDDIVSYSIRDGGHAWPVDGDCAWWGECVSATDVIWEFFRAHPKRK